jgi:uncharacterized DUF497 family protein
VDDSVDRLQVRLLEWDEWNEQHVSKHGLTRDTVEFICASEPIKYKESYKSRILVIGPDREGRLMTLVLGRVPHASLGTYYAFSARPSDRKEQQFYEQARRP